MKMKKLIIGLLLAIALAMGGAAQAATFGKLEFKIDESMPAKADAYDLSLAGTHENKLGAYALVNGSGKEDSSYNVYYVIAVLGEQKSVIGMGTFHVVDGEVKDQVDYADVEFLKSGKISGELSLTGNFITPADLDAIPGAVGYSI